jgi:hypothetical protein
LTLDRAQTSNSKGLPSALPAQAAQRELSNFDEADLVDEAVRGHHIATGSHVHIPNYIATAGE